MLAADRRKRILDLLNQQGVVQIKDLSYSLDVSTMTIHRDLDKLAAEGRLHKVRGGAVSPPEMANALDTCPTCHEHASGRNVMIIHLKDGTDRQACCSHCGLLALAKFGDEVESALATDFIYGRKVNARSASYVVAPQITICCTPTVLAFERDADAQRFQAGFGGEIYRMDGALDALRHHRNM